MALTLTTCRAPKWKQAAESLKAIAHPVRLAMIDLLREGEKNVTEIHLALGLEQAVASQHLSILRDKGVCVSRRAGKHAYYHLQDHALVDAVELVVKEMEHTR
ncbi:MAG: ArsR family transcriptional regulator [Bacteroidetes bacterium]|nr:MAG: ArsR family transcriptional regulator [Bacteroidota bacterium]